MFDAALQPLTTRLLGPPAHALAARGIRADHVTLAGFALGLAALCAVALGHSLWGLALLAANRLADGLDGEIARATGPTHRGAFVDIALDFIFYALFPLGFALADPGRNALPAAVLIASFMATGASFLTFAAVSAQSGTPPPRPRDKGIAYLGGLTEGAETIAVFAAMCLWPGAFAPLALAFAAACWVTALTRLVQGWRAFTER
ncbi:MAG: hypothetical protein CSA74_07035 [Rhodobacterales bacterium]|nr:MAG: hypothetical protein CSA74_07035 [Rhodobacterales bacterium]